MMIEELDYNRDKFADIVAKDNRFDARAYALLVRVLDILGGEEHDRHFSGEDILEEFKEEALDQFGPLTYTVLTEWGLHQTEDIGEMMFNLVDSNRIGRDENDGSESFVDGYDFKETFSDPYQT